MKRLLLLTFAAFAVAIINAAPTAQDITIIAQPGQPFVTGDLSQYVSGGVQPYTFTQAQLTINGALFLNTNGSFKFDLQGLPAIFHYKVTDKNGTSNIGTVRVAAPIEVIGEIESEVG